MLKTIMENHSYFYLLKPLINFTSIKSFSKCITTNSTKITNDEINNWDSKNTQLKNAYFSCAYLHIKKHKNTYTLTIFSSIDSEDFRKHTTMSDKSWYILKKKKNVDEIIEYLKNGFIKDYTKHWLTRNDISSEYDEKNLDFVDLDKYWFKCTI